MDDRFPKFWDLIVGGELHHGHPLVAGEGGPLSLPPRDAIGEGREVARFFGETCGRLIVTFLG